MYTDDPLGIGGLLSDAAGITRLRLEGVPVYDGLLENVLSSSAAGLDSFTHSGSLELPARSRLAFRELGLSIGLAGIGKLPGMGGKKPEGIQPGSSSAGKRPPGICAAARKDRTVLAGQKDGKHRYGQTTGILTG